MKLLLTSNGLCNKSISDALFELVGKPASETHIAFIPTAMNVDDHNKTWFINDLSNIGKQGCKFVDIVDISAMPINMWKPRLEVADVLFFSGGVTPHLMRWITESGLEKMLPKLLKTKVYAGISAGTIVTNPTLAVSSEDKKIAFKEATGYAREEALNLVDFYIRPHYNSPIFPNIRKPWVEEMAKKLGKTVYGIDDQSALKVVDGKVEVISEGEWVKV